MEYLFLLLGLLAWLPKIARAQGPPCPQPDPGFHLYLLVGQSNMAGRGPIIEALQGVGHARLFMLNAAGDWVPARHGVLLPVGRIYTLSP